MGVGAVPTLGRQQVIIMPGHTQQQKCVVLRQHDGPLSESLTRALAARSRAAECVDCELTALTAVLHLSIRSSHDDWDDRTGFDSVVAGQAGRSHQAVELVIEEPGRFSHLQSMLAAVARYVPNLCVMFFENGRLEEYTAASAQADPSAQNGGAFGHRADFESDSPGDHDDSDDDAGPFDRPHISSEELSFLLRGDDEPPRCDDCPPKGAVDSDREAGR